MLFRWSKSSSRKTSSGPRTRRPRFEPLEDRRLLAIDVTNAGDGSTGGVPDPGTLRAAIAAVNAGTDNTIHFNSAYTIHLQSQLDPITHDGVHIDGNVSGSNVTLDGGAHSVAIGLSINASDCTIENLTIENFTQYGIEIASTISESTITPSDGNTVTDCTLTGNGIGVAIIGQGTTGTRDHFIGPTAGARRSC